MKTLSEKIKKFGRSVVSHAKSFLELINEKRPRRHRYMFLKDQINDLKDDIKHLNEVVAEMDEFRVNNNKLILRIRELESYEQLAKEFRLGFQNCSDQLIEERERKVQLNKIVKSMEIEKMALEELCYKKTEEVIVATKTLEMMKAEAKIREKAQGKEKGNYIG